MVTRPQVNGPNRPFCHSEIIQNAPGKLGWPSVLAIWLYSKEKLAFHNFMTGSDFATWNKAATKVRAPTLHRHWEIRDYLPWCLHSKVTAARFWAKTQHQAYLVFQRMCRHFKEWKSAYNRKFCKVNALRKRKGEKSLPVFSTGISKPLNFNLNFSLQLLSLLWEQYIAID